MKKLAFLFVAAAAISFVSCDNKAKTQDAEDTDVLVEEEVEVCDSVCGDTVASDTTVVVVAE